MIRILKIVGNLIWVTLIALLLFGLLRLEPPIWSGILFGAALAGIPADYSLDAQRVVAWVALLSSVLIMGSRDYDIWTFFGFLIFGLSGVAAGLPFEAGDGRGDVVD